jgi:hypothetical protein
MGFVLLIAIIGLAVIGFTALKPLGQIIRIRRIATMPIAALPDAGPAEVVGRAGGAELRSPLSDASCLLWQVEVQELRSTGKSSHWKTIFKHASDQPFEIDDGTGQIQVLPAGATLILNDDLRASRGLFGNMTPEIEAALERIGVQTHGFLGLRRRLRVRERLVAPGEQIFALGYVERVAGRPVLRSMPDATLILADRSERDLLRNLYWRVGASALFALIVLGVVGWMLLVIGGRP